ncbi:acyl-CoA dehydrogenase [Desulfosudis oleivorans]|uniref:3-methylmercaptopropionyl-CoA dehydrogenase n=1 Tax=Desulfosudis oleivorans (strain DSM 6200 / JCM 39069 / Hxd3) TaxID=96561 RepID=A8ZUD6_DESOH|nr:acyl-CoA dehydrogenase [Desulfosudis oleivorans]ABW67968.1 acyl-CoA dehydrogenase domain protein [Desulfosudis oleivorans Hxd3]
MAQGTLSGRRDVDFVLHEMLNVEELSKHELFADFNRKTIDMVVSEARNFALKEILPANEEGDKGCVFENGQVKTPESFKRIFDLYCEGEWIGASEDPEFGGQGMPNVLNLAAAEFFSGASMAFMMYPGLTHGAAKMIESLGTEEQKKIYVKNMYTGKWAGTMLLTEPDAGTDVGALTTTAKKNDDGTYSITGNKIFISAGEHDMTENIIHPVLARIEGAPAGTRGISLFIVPKYRVNPDGSLGEFNDVVCTGIEEKMGIHGNATCSLTLGGKGNCIGTLLGQENKGMKAMFLMMNEARFGVGVQGFSLGATSFANAVAYAKERIQGRELLKFMDADAPSVNIIKHPDVRRQLLVMKSYVEGMRALLYYVARCFDMERVLEESDEKEKYKALIEFLIPVVKAYCTDKGFEVCVLGMQVYGGYGYIAEYPQEQLVRDCKITSIYEGTNGVQAMDLLARKLGMKGGKPLMDLMGEMGNTVAQAKAVDGLKELAESVEKASAKLGEVAMAIGQTAMSEKVLDAFGSATPFLEVTGDVVMAWLHLWRATVAAKALASGNAKKKDEAFYQGQVKTAQFFIQTLLPMAMGKMDGVKTFTSAVMEIPEDGFMQ